MPQPSPPLLLGCELSEGLAWPLRGRVFRWLCSRAARPSLVLLLLLPLWLLLPWVCAAESAPEQV